MGTFNISLPRVKWEKLTSAMCHSDCVVCCITGFVREKEIIPFKKGHYDKITKTSTAGKQEAKRVLEFASFTLFYLNEYGLISGSEEELAAVSELMRQGEACDQAILPDSGM